jgi:hypothetical protein
MAQSTPEAQPEPSLQSPEPASWEWVAVDADDRSLCVYFLRGGWNALHHVDVELRPVEVVIGIVLGWTREHAERVARGEAVAYALAGFEEWARVVLPEPLLGRRIVDAVPNAEGEVIRARR